MEKASIIVGIPSYNEADSIPFVTTQVDIGLQRFFGTERCLILNLDNSSPDNTRAAFLSTATRTRKAYISTPPGVRGKGNNMLNLLRAALRSDAKAIACVDADLRSICPEWMHNLLSPVLKGFDLASPCYLRHKYDGTITNNIVYPLVYGLLGKNLRQPIGGDFAFSPRLARHWLSKEWTSTTRQYGVDNFMTTHALLGGFRLCQANLGAKVHKVSQPKLNIMFAQVVDTLFRTLLQNVGSWNTAETIEELPGYGAHPYSETPALELDLEQVQHTAASEFSKQMPMLREALTEETFAAFHDAVVNNNYCIGPDLWARAVYGLMMFYSAGKQNETVECLRPLYFARIAAFARQTAGCDHAAAESIILEQARTFHKLRPYIMARLCAPVVLDS